MPKADKRGTWKAIRHKLEEREARDMAKLLSMTYNIPANKMSQGAFGWMLVVPLDRLDEAELALAGSLPEPVAVPEETSPEPPETLSEPSVPSPQTPAPPPRPRPRPRRDSMKKHYWLSFSFFLATWMIIKFKPPLWVFGTITFIVGLGYLVAANVEYHLRRNR